MRNLRHKLLALLVLQLVMATGLWVASHRSKASSTEPLKLLAFDQAKVDRVELERGQSKLALVKSSDGWTLPDYHGLKADQEKVSRLLTDLIELRSVERVAQTAAAHERMEVSKEKPSAKVRLLSGDGLVAEVFIGKSPAFGKQYVRSGDQEDVHAVRWSATDVQPNGSAWFDRKLLASGPLQELKFKNFALTLENGAWKSGSEALDQAKAKELVDKVERLEVYDAKELPLSGTLLLEAVEQGSKQRVKYLLATQGGDRFVKRETDKLWFKISPDRIAPLENPTLDSLKAESAEGSK